MRVSIASYTFHGLMAEGMMDVFGYIESTKYRYHLDAADIWNGMLTSTDDAYIGKIRMAMDGVGLSLENLCCDWCQAWDADPEARRKYRDNARAHLRAAVILGAKTVRIDFGGQEQEMTAEQFDWTVDCFREYAAFAKDNGFRVGPENHYGPARVLKNQLDVAKAVDSDAYGMLLHFGNWAHTPDECDVAVTPLVIHTHIDQKHCEGNLVTTLQPLVSHGYTGSYSAEHHSAKNEHMEIALQVAQVRKALTLLGVN